MCDGPFRNRSRSFFYFVNPIEVSNDKKNRCRQPSRNSTGCKRSTIDRHADEIRGIRPVLTKTTRSTDAELLIGFEYSVQLIEKRSQQLFADDLTFRFLRRQGRFRIPARIFQRIDRYFANIFDQVENLMIQSSRRAERRVKEQIAAITRGWVQTTSPPKYSAAY